MLYCINFSLFNVCCSATYILLEKTNRHFLFWKINLVSLWNLKSNNACHYFSKRSYFYSLARVGWSYNFVTIQKHFACLLSFFILLLSYTKFSIILYLFGLSLINNVSLRSYVFGRVERLCIVFVELFLKLKNLSFFLLQILLILFLLDYMPRIHFPRRRQLPAQSSIMIFG